MKLPSPTAAFPSMIGSPTPSLHPTGEGSTILPGRMNWEPVQKRLLGPDLKDALQAATELREGIEIVHTTEYPNMLAALLPAFSSILSHKTGPSPDISTLEHKLRNGVLEIISRFPSNEVLRPHAPHMVVIALDILNRDFEDNSLIASRIIFDLYKVYRSLPQDYVQPYLDFVQTAYRTLPTALQRNFSLPALAAVPPPGSQLAKGGGSVGMDLASVGEKELALADSLLTPAKGSSDVSPSVGITASPMLPASPVPRMALRSNSSFRVLTECPLIVMLMFQLYPKFLKSNIPTLINIMMEALTLRAPSIQTITAASSQTLDSNAQRLYYSRCRELVAAQAKTLSFLTYLLRGFSSELKPYEDRLATNVVALMSTCPREFISTRKELLVATRHLLNSDFRNGFFRHVDALLDERVLMGSHHRYSDQTILRPLGYTTLSDLVHHVRSMLTMPQMSRVVCMFSRVLHDSSMTLPMSTQYTAVRTLLSVVDIVFHNKDRNPQIGRDILVRILKTLVDKLSTLKGYYLLETAEATEGQEHSEDAKHIVGQNAEEARTTSSMRDQSEGGSGGGLDDQMLAKLELPVGTDPAESIRDLKSMVRAIIVGHKTVIWYINNYRAQREKDKVEYTPPPGANEEVASAMLKMTHLEHALIDRYIVLALPCMKLLRSKNSTVTPGSQPQNKKVSHDSASTGTPDQYRDALTYFASAFTTLDGYELRRTLGRRLELVANAIVDDPTVMIVPRHLLQANEATSFAFCSVLLDFLVERMDLLSSSLHREVVFVPPPTDNDFNEVERLKSFSAAFAKAPTESADLQKRRSSIYLQLFERVLKSLSTYPENESALRPHLRRIVSTCLLCSMGTSGFHPDNFCMLLRYVFRSISAGKFEESYRELLPLIPTVLNGLYRVLRATDDSVHHYTIIELLLTIPARLSSLLPHMNLLLRVIVRALQASSGDLVNLGLRTLEFWVDNLNPEFLYPELSKQLDLFVDLMKALSTHLRPAPYPYGLLTLRLLGKLGGNNRGFLREPMDICEPSNFKEVSPQLRAGCNWAVPDSSEFGVDVLGDTGSSTTSETMEAKSSSVSNDDHFSIPLPIDRCVQVLKEMALSQKSLEGETSSVAAAEEKTEVPSFSWKESNKLWNTKIENIDLLSYCEDVMAQTKQSQVEAALRVLHSTLVPIVGVNRSKMEDMDINCLHAPPLEVEDGNNAETVAADELNAASSNVQARNSQLESIGLGLMYGCAVDSIQEKATVLLTGLYTHVFLVVSTHQKYIKRIDANGSWIVPPSDGELRDTKTELDVDHGDIFEDGLGSLKPFGYFEQTGPLRYRTNPMALNKAFAEYLTEPNARSKAVALGVLTHILKLPAQLRLDGDPPTETDKQLDRLDRGSLIFFENLLSALCEKCVTSTWNRRDGIYDGICILVETLGSIWSRKYEIEIMNVALFSVKSAPREMSASAITAFRFLVRVTSALYGNPVYQRNSLDDFVWDMLAVVGGKEDSPNSPDRSSGRSESATLNPVQQPCDDVLQLLIIEMASTKPIVRTAARFVLKHFIIDACSRESCGEVFRKQLPLLRRVLFSRSLRLLPLPEQVGAVEALSVVIFQVPEVIPLTDQHLLAFLSELLKMSSVADGEMSDPNLVGFVVDKNGFAVSVQQKPGSGKDPKTTGCSLHASSLFLRQGCILTTPGAKIVLSEELPCGVQLRVSSICLLRSVIRGHPDAFFDAEPSTPIGNIRPHVISLLFRSLVSCPLKAVVAAHDALRDVLSLSVVASAAPDGSKSKSRLPKELLQTCIRPVLLNLRDYTKLSVGLLRGLSRLLSLLSSWFNKTLGEKLLDHLQKWTDPNRIKSQKIWKEGDEPGVAAAIVDLFALLPHASHFVEPLVKTTIKLEACLPAFKTQYVLSPYRKPLARYLNKHCQYTVGFFFPRLKTPLYSELFQDIVTFEESKPLREYLGGRQCSVTILNVCFERPLAIIRSEKTSTGANNESPVSKAAGGGTNAELLAVHGLKTDESPAPTKESILRQEVEVKQKKALALQQEMTRTQEAALGKTSSSGSSTAELQVAKEEARKKHKAAKAAYDKAAKDFNESKQRYAAEVAEVNARKASTKGDVITRPMNIESLELQHQGFRLVDTLIANDKDYLKDHNDVLRAFRWLWRSKGRYLRLQHEESVSPRYHGETKMLASFLVNYATLTPNDVDILFELIRIFLQSTTNDFSFVKSFLAEAVTEKLTAVHKRQIIQRFFALLAGESTEETKTLSIQLVVYPMLRATFLSRGSEMSISETAEKQLNTDDQKPSSLGKSEASTDFVDAAVVRRFVKEVLFHEGRPIMCGDRLKVELLRMSDLLLEFLPIHVQEFRGDMIKFCWSLLKSDDTSCKCWSYVVICRFISVFDTPTKIILQVYGSLMRSHQQEGRDLVRNALDLLVPSLPKRLPGDEFRKTIEQTNRIMFEDGNSVSQLAHIWHTIINHHEVFYFHRHQFVRYMINSLNRLGLPQSCPIENRSLAISIIELVIQWDELHQDSTVALVPMETPVNAKRKKPDTVVLESGGLHSDKKQRVASGALGLSSKNAEDCRVVLDQSMVDTVANFLIRLKVLLADPKVDAGTGGIDVTLTNLLRRVARRWKQCAIRPVYFEKVVSMCQEDNGTRGGDKGRGKTAGKAASKPSKTVTPVGGAKGDAKLVTSPLLSACLDVFAVLAEEAPLNAFLVNNSSQWKEILASCFNCARHRDEVVIQGKLRQCVVRVLSAGKERPQVDVNLLLHINVMIEQILVDAESYYRKSVGDNQASSEASRQGRSKARADEDGDGACPASFALQIIEEVCETRPAYFKTFSSTLLVLASTLVKKHIAAASAKQKQGGAPYVPQSPTTGLGQMYHTPVEGILCESSANAVSQSAAAGTRPGHSKEPYPSKELRDFDQTLRSTVVILRILGHSDIPYSFTQDRKTLFQITSNILDSSSNVQLLMGAVRIVGKWLLSEMSGGPLTVKERNSFLWKIASFNSHGLPDVVAQPLADLVAHYVISFLGGRSVDASGSGDAESTSSGVENFPRFSHLPQRVSDSDDMIMGRSLVACLLTANHGLREKLLSLFASHSVDTLRSRRSQQNARGTVNFAVSPRSPLEILWQLFHSDFEGLGGRSWIVVFVELLLASVRPDGVFHVTNAPSADHVSGFKRWLPLPRDDKPTSSRSATVDTALEDGYAKFCESLADAETDFSQGGVSFLKALRILAHGDAAVCQLLFETLLPAAWARLPSDGMRLRLVPAIESLLSRPFHSQLLKERNGRRNEQRTMNVIRSFLNAVGLLAPLPTLDVDLLVSLAETYNCWYEVLSLLEQQHLVLSSNEISAEGKALKDKNLLAMRHCHRQLGESNAWLSLALKSCVLPETVRAVSLDVHGRVKEAVEAYSELVELAEANELSATDLEMDLWEERWVELQREQCQLAVVSEYATSSENSRLLLECAWKEQNWDKVRALSTSSALVAAVEAGDPAVKMSETLLAVADGKLSDVENLHAQTAQLCLYKWQLLPDIASGSLAHASLLQFFHRLVEIRESGQIMVETSNHSNGKTLPDLKNLLNAWRHRLPNDYENMTVWDDVFTWRTHMFSAITSNFHWSEPSTLATLHDRPWTAIRMAMTARKQGMGEVALLLLNKLTDSRAMDVSDAFLKLREQILVYNSPDNDMERTGGLNLINTTNLSFFDPPQKSELFRLKAMFLASLGGRSKSNQAYCHSVQICPTHSRAWVSWGGLCSSLAILTEKQADQLSSKTGGTVETKESRASSKKVSQYLAQAMGCYLEAIQIDTHEKARVHLPKLLWSLTKDGSSPGVLCQTLENRGIALPAWVWLPWVPQLLTCLCRIEGRAIKAIVARLVKSYPQAVYYSLRAFYLERRDVERSKGVPSSSGKHMGSVAFAEEMMSTLRRSHASLWSSLEAILEELIVKFRPSYEEELLATISALLERAESHSERHSLPDKTKIEDEEAMVASWSKTLSRIAAKFFRSSDASSGSNRRDERVKKTAEFKRKYKTDFEDDFKVQATDGQAGSPTSEPKPQFRLEEYITRLQKWKRKLESQVACTPIALPLIESSHSLAMFAGDVPDLWPGSCDPRHLTVKEERDQAAEGDNVTAPSSTSSSASAARKAADLAAVAAASAAAKEGVGGEYGGGSAAIEIPGQYCPNACSSSDVKPSPELHAKLMRFEPFIEVLRRNNQLVRRAGMVGSDGRVYRFLLQFAIPYWTRTDERTAQTHYVIDKFLRRSTGSARNHLSVQPNAAIPVAQRLRLTLDVESRISLDEVFTRSCDVGKVTHDRIATYFLEEVTRRLKEKHSDVEGPAYEEKIAETRLEVYHDICKTKVDNGILLRHMQSVLDGPEPLFQFRRAFASQLAINSLLQYAFSTAERTPPRFVLIQRNARILSPDFRVSYTNHGFIESQSVPFRMTPNLVAFVGQPYLEDRFITSFAMVSEAIRENKEDFDPILRLLMRDDILAWYSKSLAKSDSKTQELEKQLIERVTQNVATLQLRFAECAPRKKTETRQDPVDKKVRQLYAAATNAEKLCMMPTSYAAWL